jgi:hypothetical protein
MHGTMLNVLSFLIGIVSLIIVIPAQIPLLGWANWLALPLVVIGVVVGALSSKTAGRNFCLVIFAVAAVRLMLGGGLI